MTGVGLSTLAHKLWQIQINLVGFTCCDPSDWILWRSSTFVPISGNSKCTNKTCKLKTGNKCTCPTASQVLWRSSTLASIYLCQSTKWPRNAIAWKLQHIIHYRLKNAVIFYKLMSLQLCDLTSGTFLCMLLHDHDTHVIIVTVRLQEATGYKLVISPILGKHPIYSQSLTLRHLAPSRLVTVNRIHLSLYSRSVVSTPIQHLALPHAVSLSRPHPLYNNSHSALSPSVA